VTIPHRTRTAVALLSAAVLSGWVSAAPASANDEVTHAAALADSTSLPAAVGVGLAVPEGGDLTMFEFLESVLFDVDAYWSAVWADSGLPTPFVNYQFPGPGERVPIPAQCSPDPSGSSDDFTAQYCPVDDAIVISQALAELIEDGEYEINQDADDQYPTGDFSVAYVVAHEYAHSLQGELDLIPTPANDFTVQFPLVQVELHADCWAGVWANSAAERGILEPGDLEEAVQTTMDVGDYDTGAPAHHGTPAQRSEAFLTGYDSGEPVGCEGYLSTDLSTE
jgi:predicted metalloprotease